MRTDYHNRQYKCHLFGNGQDNEKASQSEVYCYIRNCYNINDNNSKNNNNDNDDDTYYNDYDCNNNNNNI